MKLEHAVKWRDDAVADGWAIRPTYNSEDVSMAATLNKEGFTVQVITRVYDEAFMKTAQPCLAAWGPDTLSIEVPIVYSWEALNKGLTVCGECGSEGVETKRVGFAGRCCVACLPAARKRLEYPGWDN